MEKIDTSGLSCPQPVIMVKRAVDKKVGELEVLVDSNVSKENVSRFLESEGYKITEEADGQVTKLKASK